MKFQIFLLFTIFYLLLFFLYPISAQTITTTCAPSTSPPPRVTGLVTTPSLLGKFYTSQQGKCIVSLETVFVPFKIPTYLDLKSIYFDQARGAQDKVTISGDLGEGGLAQQLSAGKKLIYITGSLGINNNVSGTTTAVVFVDGNLLFASPMSQFTYGDQNSGIVFVVGGNVFIDLSLIRIDATVISQGTICTGSEGTSCPPGYTSLLPLSSRLVINGSLISLDTARPIRFRRTLTDNTAAAEIISHQVKYLVILRNIFAQTLQKWSEIGP